MTRRTDASTLAFLLSPLPPGDPLPEHEPCWNNAVPTLGHMALLGLMRAGMLQTIISQNIDGT